MGITCDDIGVPKTDLAEKMYACDAETYGTCAENYGTGSTFGGYDVSAANVALAGVVEDIASIGDELPTDFAAAKTIYTTGANLQTTTLQAMAKGTRGSYTSGATFTAFNSLFPPATDAAGETMWNDLILDSLDDNLGSAHTGADLESFRKYGVNKGVLGACIFEALNLLEAALAAGPSAAAQDHVDQAWAVYYGSRASGGKSAAEVTKKRESSGDFGDTGLNVFARLSFAFQQTRDALAATGGNADAAADGVKLIKKMIILTFARATIKYSHTRKPAADDYDAAYHMEGDAYYRIFAGVALSFLENNEDAKAELDLISAKMDYKLAASAITFEDDHCDVKKKVEAMYVRLELDCNMVGVKSSLPECPTTCRENMGVERYFYIPQSDIFDVAELSLDVVDMKTKSGPDGDAFDFTGAATTYQDGLGSTSLQSIAQRDDSGQMFFDGLHELTGSKTSVDDIISNALAGTGDFDGKSDSFRYYAVAKCGIAALQLQTMYLLETALTEAAAGTATAASKWDQAYAVFTGVSGGAAGTVGQLVGGVMQKRDSDFPAPAVVARDHVMKHFAAGQKAILADTYDAAAATAAAAEIRRLIGITFARATIKYSSTMKDADPITDPGVYSDTGHPEGFCYWRAMAGWMTKTSGKNTALEIDALLALTLNDADITQPDTHCSVKQKLETMLGGMGITCDDIGAP